MFFFKPKTVTMDCFTYRVEVHTHAPVAPADRFIPDWWRKLPKTGAISPVPGVLNTDNNMRGCIGMTDMFKVGVIIPLWSDLMVELGTTETEEFMWQFSDRESHAGIHEQAQRGSAYPANFYTHLKIVSPWFFRASRSVKCLFSQPTWNIEAPETMVVLPGVIDYAKMGATEVNLLFPRGSEPRKFIVPYGQPLVQIIPMTEANLQVKTHLVSEEEFLSLKKKTMYPVSFSNPTHKLAKYKKCPFHGGKG
jgi:hypothetical protein